MPTSSRHRKEKFGASMILAAVLALILLSAGCGGAQTSSAEPERESTSGGSGEETRDGARDERDEDGARAVAGEVTADSEEGVNIGNQGSSSSDSAEGSASRATLEMMGASGTAFSGTCEFGEETLDVSGEVPASFDLALDGQRLDCEVLKEGEGRLRMEFNVGNSRNVYQTTSSDATIKLTYSEGSGASFSYSSSSSSSSSVVQQNSSSHSNSP